MMKNTKASLKFNRCIEFVLPNGKVIDVKVLGEKTDAKANAALLLSALTVTE